MQYCTLRSTCAILGGGREGETSFSKKKIVYGVDEGGGSDEKDTMDRWKGSWEAEDRGQKAVKARWK